MKKDTFVYNHTSPIDGYCYRCMNMNCICGRQRTDKDVKQYIVERQIKKVPIEQLKRGDFPWT